MSLTPNLFKNLESLKVDGLMKSLDGSGSITERKALKDIANQRDSLPKYLCKCFYLSKNAKVRAQCIFYLFSYAKVGDEFAIALGIEALKDKAKIVRYNACKLLAYAQDEKAILYLKNAKSSEKDTSIIADIVASIDAIENKNHNWFVDREHTGLVTMDSVDRL